MDEQQRIIRGAEANALLDNPLFKAAFDGAREVLLAKMRTVSPTDEKAHTELVRRIQTVDTVERFFRKTIEDGQIARNELDHRRTLRERIGFRN